MDAVPTITAALLDTEGVLTEVELDAEDTLSSMYRLIGCAYALDALRLSPILDMWLDDAGMYDAEINPAATRIARIFGFVRQPYFGKALFTGAGPAGITIALSQDQITVLRAYTHLPSRSGG